MKVLLSGFESSSANESLEMLTDDSKFEDPLMQTETQRKLKIQIRNKRKFESDDKSKMIDLLRDSVKYQTRNNEILSRLPRRCKWNTRAS